MASEQTTERNVSPSGLEGAFPIFFRKELGIGLLCVGLLAGCGKAGDEPVVSSGSPSQNEKRAVTFKSMSIKDLVKECDTPFDSFTNQVDYEKAVAQLKATGYVVSDAEVNFPIVRGADNTLRFIAGFSQWDEAQGRLVGKPFNRHAIIMIPENLKEQLSGIQKGRHLGPMKIEYSSTDSASHVFYFRGFVNGPERPDGRK